LPSARAELSTSITSSCVAAAVAMTWQTCSLCATPVTVGFTATLRRQHGGASCGALGRDSDDPARSGVPNVSSLVDHNSVAAAGLAPPRWLRRDGAAPPSGLSWLWFRAPSRCRNRATAMTDTDTERELYRPPRFMTKQEKLEEIRKMRAALRGEAQKESNRE
jgi:hypothetical protein